MDHGTTTPQGQVAAIALALRVPPFWRDKPRLWFISFEAATSELRKSQEQLAQMVIAQLEKQDIEQISDILYDPPPTELYHAIKNRLISTYEESDSRQLQRLLSETELGDQKPTQLLRRMRSLARSKFPDSTLRLMWTNHLPPHVRSVLAVSESLNTMTALDEIALLADKMMEVNPNSQIAAVENTKQSASHIASPDINSLISEVRSLSCEIASLKNAQQATPNNYAYSNNRRPFYCRGRSEDRRYGSTRSRSPTPPQYCFYHHRFGDEARRCSPPCSFKTVGKLTTTLDEAGSGVSEKSYRLFVTDKKTRATFLIDTGANISVLPPQKGQTQEPLKFQLYAANNTVIPTYGEKTLQLDLNLRRPFKWRFIVAKVRIPIIGADFLEHHQLIVDIKNRKLIDGKTNLSTQSYVRATNYPTIRSIDVQQTYHDILADFPGVTRITSMELTPKNNVEHFIESTGPPLYCRARPIAPHRYEFVRKEFENMIEQGLCRPSKSPWSSPLHIVPKKNGDLRVCGDYRRLNNITIPDRYPIPRIKDFTFQLSGKKIFSTIDLNRAYQQIKVREEDIEKTAIITPMGLFEFPRMTPGLRNAGQTFQRFIHEVLHGLDFVYAFIDDLLVASPNQKTHEEHLRTVLRRLEDNGITINPSKCIFAQDEVKFLGLTVSKEGIKPPAEKVAAICSYPKPSNIEELRRFLGMLNFYREHIPKAAEIQIPLHSYLHNTKKRDKTKIEWTDIATESFEACKRAIQNATLLAHPSHDAALAIFSDASDLSAGAVLQQFINGKWKPLGYFSKKFSEAQSKYSTFDRELLAIYMATKHFRKIFEGRNLIIFTDHKPLTYILKKPPSPSETPRRARQLIFISEFTTDIRHVSGKDNIVADALSRITIETIACPTTLDYEEIAAEQENDKLSIEQLAKQSNICLKRMTTPLSQSSIYCETSTPFVRPYLPEKFRRAAFDAVHNISHPGIRSTQKLVTEKFFWPSMNIDVRKWAKHCIQCQRCKVQRHTTSSIATFPPSDRFQHVHIDIVGPLPASPDGQRYLVTMIDRATRWPEAIPTDDTSAESVARIFYEHWICRFGSPALVTSDQGRNFDSRLFAKLLETMGSKKTRTTAYHPQSNGIVERWHRSLKTALKTRLSQHTRWIDELPTVLMGLRAAVRLDTGVSTAQLTYGTNLRLPCDFFSTTNAQEMDEDYVTRLRTTINNVIQNKPIAPHGNNRPIFVHQDLRKCEQVFIRKDGVKATLQPTYEGPYKVLERDSKKFTLQLPERRSAVISIDRLKPAYTTNSDNEVSSECSPSAAVNSIPKNTSVPQDEKATSHNKATKSILKTTRCGRISKPPVRFG